MLPSVKYTPAQLSKRYGLKTSFESAKVLQLQPLQSQLEAFKAWMTQPINLARGQQKFVAMTTWNKGFESIIHMYLGFCYHMAGVAQPCLEHFLDGNMCATYTDFLLQRRIVRSSFEKPCVVGKNVADFFMAKLDADHNSAITRHIILEPVSRVLLEKTGEQCRTVFVNSGGTEMTGSLFSYYFTKLLTKLGTSRLTPQQLRTIFVAERRSATAVEGPGEVGAALAMGNSPGMWDKHGWGKKYDTRDS
ncbi:hypothetical protein WJX79_009543 [Trebouxia sp. C0005]